jgi:thymidine phosphorylase
MSFAVVELICTKRDGGVLGDAEIDWLIDAYTRGEVADEQMSALAMAILLRGMTPAEIARWTAAMIASGDRMDLSGVGRPTVDKHSTGGVGDKITLPLTPLVAACGAAVPQLSGRGLGRTGGTLDKLESIPGWRSRLSNAEFLAQLAHVGAAICAAGSGLAPADGKVGSGAFMKSMPDARELASTMVQLGAAHGVRTVALLTDMSTPLGYAIGNAVEVTEALEVLSGGGPSDVVTLTLALAREMLNLAGLPDADPAAVLADGRAMDSWRAMVRAQGGDPDAPLPVAAETEVVRAETSGFVTSLDAYDMGVVAWRLGAGRARKEDPVSPPAGVILGKRRGDPVAAGDVLYELRADDPARLEAVRALARGAVVIEPAPPPPQPLVLERIA